MITPTEKLLREFEEMKSLELEAESFYGSMLPYITDPIDKGVVEGIMHDEHKHALLVDQMIEIVNENTK